MRLLVALGFREVDGGGALELNLDADLAAIEARRLEVEVGLDRIRNRIRNWGDTLKPSTQKSAAGAKMPSVDQSVSKQPDSESSKITSAPVSKKQAAKQSELSKQEVVPSEQSASSAKMSEGASAKASLALRDERTKRMKAEAALNQQRDLVKELQAMVSNLQTDQENNLTLRQSITISRMGQDDIDIAKKKAKSLGKDSFAFNHLNLSPRKKSSNTLTSNNATDEVAALKDAIGNAGGSTTLMHAALAGECILHVRDNMGFKKGMKILVGSGLTIEEHTVVRLGSLILDRPLAYDHPMGSKVRCCPLNSKGQPIQRYITAEFVKGVLYEIVISNAESLGEQNVLAGALTQLYADRPVYRHIVLCDLAGPAVLFPGAGTENETHGSGNGVLCSSSRFSKLIHGSSISCLGEMNLKFNSVDMLYLFLDVGLKEYGSFSDALHLHMLPSEVSFENLLLRIESDNSLRGLFQNLAEIQMYQCTADLLRKYSSQTNDRDFISWPAYCKLINPESEKLVLPTSFANKDQNQVDWSQQLLLRVFDLFDIDADDFLLPDEVIDSFSSLDGSCVDIDIINDCCRKVEGTSLQAASRIDCQTYINIRIEYASAVNTLVAGFRLYGKLKLLTTAESLLSALGTHVPTQTLLNALPESVLFSTILPLGKNAILNSLLSRYSDTSVSIGDLHDMVSGRLNVCGPLLPTLSAGASMRRWNQSSELMSKVFVVQIVSDDRRGRVISVCSNGIAYIYETETGSLVFKQRLIWSEPLPTRAVEGGDRFVKWRKDSGLLGYDSEDGYGISLTLVAKEALASSVALAEYHSTILKRSAGIHSSFPSPDFLSVDDASGLLIVNCSISSRSLCIHDPISLRRLYRIKAPGQLSEEMQRTTRELASGRALNDKIDGKFKSSGGKHQDCFGYVHSLVPLAVKSAILCAIAGESNLYIINMLTGEPMSVLSGHTEMISCLSASPQFNLLYSGAADCTIRVWSISDFIDTADVKTATSTADVNEGYVVKKLEQKLLTGAIDQTTSRLNVRNLATALIKKLGVRSRWRIGRISGFLCGDKYKVTVDSREHTLGVEVVFSDNSVQLYSNKSLLREPTEVALSPRGPPLWRNDSALLEANKEVALFEADPEEFAIILARALGVSLSTAMSHKFLKDQLECFFSGQIVKKMNGGGTDTAATTAIVVSALLSLGLSSGDDIASSTRCITPAALAKRLLESVSDHRPMASRSCYRRLSGGHQDIIVSVNFFCASKLLVSIDSQGNCSVWDPVDNRVCLSIDDPTQMFDDCSLLKGYPSYSLVSRCSLSEAFGKGFNISVKQVNELSMSGDSRIFFPTSPGDISNAFSLDMKFGLEEVTTRGFVYVFSDMTTLGVETSFFSPDLVYMNSADTYFSGSPLILFNSASGQCVFQGHEQLMEESPLAVLQKVFLMRNRVMRVVYFVSCFHSTFKSAVTALSQYGVLQRGLNTTPSDRIAVICFERSSEWLERSRALGIDGAGISNLQQSPDNRIYSGIILAVNEAALQVAVDFSNDIIVVDVQQVLLVFDRDNSVRRKSASANDSHTGFSPGCRIQFRNFPKKNLSWNDCEFAWNSQLNSPLRMAGKAFESLVVHLGASPYAGGKRESFVVGVRIGRISVPVPARDISNSLSEDLVKQLKTSQIAFRDTVFGKQSIATELRRSCERRAAASRNQQAQRISTLIGAAASSIVSKKIDLGSIDSTLGDLVLLSTGAFGVASNNMFLECLSGALLFMNQTVPASHPLMRHYDEHVGSALSKLQRCAGEASGTLLCSQLVDTIVNSWLNRKKLFLEEFYGGGAKAIIPFDDLECLNSCLIRSTAAVNESRAEGSDSSSLGFIDGKSITLVLLDRIVSGGNKISGENKFDPLSNRDYMKHQRLASMAFLLLQHKIANDIKLNLSSIRKYNRSSASSLKLLYLHLMKPLLLAVRDRQKRNSSLPNSINRRRPSRELNKVLDVDILEKSYAGQYTELSVTDFSAFSSRFSAQIVCGEQLRGAQTAGSTFMRWVQVDTDDVSRESSGDVILSRLCPLIDRCQLATNATMRKLDGIRFLGVSKPPPLVLEWPSDGVSLEVSCQKHGGLLTGRKPRVDELRLLGSRILASISSIHACGLIIRTLSPHTIILSEKATKIMLLPLCLDGSDIPEDDLENVDVYREQLIGTGRLLAAVSLPPREECNSTTESPSYFWDSWSFGICLFAMAFGMPSDKTLSTILSRNNNATSTATSGVGATDSAEHVDSASTSLDTAHSLLIGDTISDLIHYVRSRNLNSVSSFIGTSSDYVMKLIYRLMLTANNNDEGLSSSIPSERLFQFRHEFTSSSMSIGLSELSSSSLWERLIHAVFCRAHKGRAATFSIRDELVALGSGKDVDAARLKDIVIERFGIQLTTQEVDLLIRSLTPSLGGDHLFKDRLTPALQQLGALIDDIYMYGCIQQIVYAISKCLSETPSMRPTISELLDLEIFSDLDDASHSSASIQYLTFLQRFHDATDMVNQLMLNPVRVSLARLAASMSAEDEKSRGDTDYVVDDISSVLTVFEEVISLRCAQVSMSQFNPGSGLNIPGVPMSWIFENSVNIVDAITLLGVLPAIAGFSLRFFSSSRALALPSDGPTHRNADVSLGSRLLIRLAKCLQHSIECLEILSRHSYKVTQSESRMSEVYADGGTSTEVAASIAERKSLEALYFAVLSTILMLYTGSETPLCHVGLPHSDLLSALPALRSNLNELNSSLLNETISGIIPENRWSAQLCKLFEPLLLSLVSEDGSGSSSKIKCSKSCLLYVDRISTRSLVHRNILKRYHFCISVMKCYLFICFSGYDASENPHIYFPCGFLPHRGMSYFSSCLRFFRGYCAVETTNKLAEDKHKALFATTIFNLIPVCNFYVQPGKTDGKVEVLSLVV